MIKIDLTEGERLNLTNDEIEVAKARKLEQLVIPYVKRNINFFYAGANIPKKAEAYGGTTKVDDVEDAIKRQRQPVATVCRPFCEMIVQILRDNGLNAETISCDTDMFKHVDVLLTTNSGKQYIINYLEDIESIQTGMKTPDFASKAYYDRRYKKFEGSTTTDGKKLDNIAFVEEETLDKIDTQLGYKKYGMYMNEVIKQIREEFKNFATIMAENEYLTEIHQRQKRGEKLTETEIKNIKEEFNNKYLNMSKEQLLDEKLQYLFEYFNERMDITGHTDFVMYYSRLLLKNVLDTDEYTNLVRYDCFVDKKKLPENSPLMDILDLENDESISRPRFCLIEHNDITYAFSTKPNAYKKLSKQEMEEISKYAIISKSQKPSDLVLKLCDAGHALPLIFNPLGSKFLNDREGQIDPNLPKEERMRRIEELARRIETTDEPITSIRIPYDGGKTKVLFITENNEFAVKTDDETTIYHYNEENDSYTNEIISNGR